MLSADPNLFLCDSSLPRLRPHGTSLKHPVCSALCRKRIWALAWHSFCVASLDPEFVRRVTLEVIRQPCPLDVQMLFIFNRSNLCKPRSPHVPAYNLWFAFCISHLLLSLHSFLRSNPTVQPRHLLVNMDCIKAL